MSKLLRFADFVVHTDRNAHHVDDLIRGPWLQTQLELSIGIGLSSFLLFCVLRKLERCKVLYAPRTLLKGETSLEVWDAKDSGGRRAMTFCSS